MTNQFFTPGPSGLYFTVEHHLKQAIKHGVTSISHRSKEYIKIHEAADQNLRSLLNLPEDYSIVFTNSATEIWEKLADTFIQQRSLHIANGAFSKKFYSVAANLGYDADLIESDWGDLPESFEGSKSDYNLIGVTHNETSTGVQTPLDKIYDLKRLYPNSVVTLDAVSSLPVVDLDYAKIDTVYASVQKAFGLPAGLGIWLINKSSEEIARKLHHEGKIRNGSHSLINLIDQSKKFQTPSTPNVLGIYLLSKVTEDMINRGIQQIRNDGLYKSAILYNLLDNHQVLRPFVTKKQLRSQTVIVIDSGAHSKGLINYLAKHKLIVGGGYGKMKGQQVRIANFPTHSKEQFEMLVDLIEKYN